MIKKNNTLIETKSIVLSQDVTWFVNAIVVKRNPPVIYHVCIQQHCNRFDVFRLCIIRLLFYLIHVRELGFLFCFKSFYQSPQSCFCIAFQNMEMARLAQEWIETRGFLSVCVWLEMRKCLHKSLSLWTSRVTRYSFMHI